MQKLEEKSPFLQWDALSKCLCKGYKKKWPLHNTSGITTLGCSHMSTTYEAIN